MAKRRKTVKRKRNAVSLAQLSRGIRAKFVKIRKVKNGIRVIIKK